MNCDWINRNCYISNFKKPVFERLIKFTKQIIPLARNIVRSASRFVISYPLSKSPISIRFSVIDIVRARQLRLRLCASGWNGDIFSRRNSICIEQLTTDDCLKRTNVVIWYKVTFVDV